MKATRDLIEDQRTARGQEHIAAVEAVFQELASIAEPMYLVLLHGNVDVQIPFALVAAYRQVMGPLYRGLPPNAGRQLAKTYSLLDIQRVAFQRLTIDPHQLRLVYNDDLVPTMLTMHQHLTELGRDIPGPPGPIDEAEISLTPKLVAAARKKLTDAQH